MGDGLVRRGFMALTERLYRRYGWDRLPRPIAMATLTGLRMTLRRKNLYDMAGTRLPWGPAPLPPGPRPLTRSVDGTGDDRTIDAMGAVGAPFSRNVPPNKIYAGDVLTPKPPKESPRGLTPEQVPP